MFDVVIASIDYLVSAIEEIEERICFLSNEDKGSFREVIMRAVPDHGRFYSNDKDVLVSRVLGILGDDEVAAGLDFSKLNEEQKYEVSRLFWAERYLYEDISDAKKRMMEILDR